MGICYIYIYIYTLYKYYTHTSFPVYIAMTVHKIINNMIMILIHDGKHNKSECRNVENIIIDPFALR